MNNEMKLRGGLFAYPDITHYADIIMDQRIWEGDGWKEESISWKESCYIHSGLSGVALRVTGPEATDFLSRISTNNVYKWKIGKQKHLVMCTDDGYVANHTLVSKLGENDYRVMACPPWPLYVNNVRLHMDVKIDFEPFFYHQISGPTAKAVIEKVSGDDISDVKFLDFRTIRFPGIDGDLEVARIGMSGTIAYEIRGAIQFSAQTYDMIYQGGQEFGIKRLGWRTYTVNHTEGGFPQGSASFMYSSYLEEGYQKMLGINTWQLTQKIKGSCDPADITCKLRTPFDLGWGFCVKFDHDFIGREALEKIAENPPHTIVTLEWNQEDVMDVYASMFGPRENEYKIFELPCLEPAPQAECQDRVTVDGVDVGISSTPIYSYYYRKFISHCTINVDQAEIGNEVIVHWGDYGSNIKEIRATVAKYPYSTLKPNQHYYDD